MCMSGTDSVVINQKSKQRYSTYYEDLDTVAKCRYEEKLNMLPATYAHVLYHTVNHLGQKLNTQQLNTHIQLSYTREELKGLDGYNFFIHTYVWTFVSYSARDMVLTTKKHF